MKSLRIGCQLYLYTINNNSGNNGSQDSGNNGNTGDNGNSGNDGNNSSKLADGIYSITGQMVKVDKVSASMSDAAINHTIKLTVKNGKYYVTLNFHGLKVGQQYGYLSSLKYFKTGYTLDKYGNPKGTLESTTVESYQENSDGSRVSDYYGTDYPKQITFELIEEALKDGFAPLQVYVPIMESISTGGGTQPVFLKLDWSTVKAVLGDDSSFDDSTNNNGSNNNTNNGNTNNDNNNGNNNNGGTNSGDDNNNGNDTNTNGSLDRYNLADGIYSLTGKMVKVDKSSASMSNEAINHTIKLTVKNGKYYVTMDFCGLKYAGQYGYLGWMKYYKSGYSTDKYGNPTGSLGSVTVDSIQKDSNGKTVSDSFGSNYPNQITYPLISEALNDGYVPLQVYVPVMESISAGTGTQPVFLKLSWDTLKKTSSDDKAFEDNTSENDTTDDDDSTSSSSLLNFKSTLKSSTLGTTSLKSASLGSVTSSLKGASSLKKSESALKNTATGLNSSMLKTTAGDGTALTSALDDGTGLGAAVASAGTDAGDAYVAGSMVGASASSNGMLLIPIGTSLVVMLAGILYKLKSRGLLKLR